MAELNQYAISKILGSTMKPISNVRFGSFGLLATTAESILAKEEPLADQGSDPNFSYHEDALVVQAFEDVRARTAPDALLWDKKLAKAFVKRCRELGLKAPQAYLARRVLHVRKNSPRYQERGIRISPTTKSEAHPSVVQEFAHVIEFALVRLRYKYGASIDDILLDPALGEEFEKLANGLAPSLSSQQLRLGALYIRKTRYLKKTDIQKIQALDVSNIEQALTPPVTLDELEVDAVPASSGLIEVREKERYLYIALNTDLRPAAGQFKSGRAFELISNGFWKPDPGIITIQFATGSSIAGTSISTWERRLIHDLEPVFNWPMQKKAS
jgi:hypothetical protein